MSTKELIVNELDTLSETDLEQVARYLAFLKHQSRIRSASLIGEDQLAALYSEFADEDREMAEGGMADYSEMLKKEDEQ